MNPTQSYSIDELLKAGLVARAAGGSDVLLATILQEAERTPQRQPWFLWRNPLPSRSLMILVALMLLLVALVAAIVIGSRPVRPLPEGIRGNGEIIVHGNDCALVAYDPVTLQGRPFFEGVPNCYPNFNEYTLAWNPAGDRLALGYRFACGRCNSDEAQRAFEEQAQGLWILTPETGALRQAVKCERRCFVESITWSPDGSRIAFSFQNHVWVARADGGEALDASAGLDLVDHPVWSPDGSLLLFAETRFEHPKVFAVDSRGEGDARVVSEEDGPITGLAWGRPDERAVLVTEVVQTGTQTITGGSIRSIDVDSGSRSLLAEFSDGSHPVIARWSPDGASLAYVLATPGDGDPPIVVETVEVRIRTDADRSVFKQPVTAEKVPRLAWSPDGEFLSLWLDQDQDFPEPGRGTYLIAADGSGARPLVELFNDQPAWRPVAEGQ